MPAAVRLAGTSNAEIAVLARTLADAHVDYPWAAWAFPVADRATLLVQLFTLDLQIGLCTDAVWVADDGASVAIWSPPADTVIDAQTRGFIQQAHAEQAALISDHQPRLQAADALTRSQRPDAPYWYLGTVGTLPERRGHGLATAVLQPILDRCDDERTVACLETSTDDNVRLYRQLGFVETFRATVDGGTLPLIVMHRPPR